MPKIMTSNIFCYIYSTHTNKCKRLSLRTTSENRKNNDNNTKLSITYSLIYCAWFTNKIWSYVLADTVCGKCG